MNEARKGVILIRCLKCEHRGTLSGQELIKFGLRPGAPIASFAKRLRCRKCGSASVMGHRSPAKAA